MDEYLDTAVLEQILKKHGQQTIVTELKKRILRHQFRDGDHYMSVAWQEVVTVANQEGRTWKEYIIIKSMPLTKLAKQFLEESGVFNKEIAVYNDILKAMAAKVNSHFNGGDLLWPECIGFDSTNLLILEDLTTKGFRKVDRLEGLDYEHSILAFKAIAKFHVLSLTQLDKLKANQELYNHFPFAKKTQKRLEFFKSKIDTISEAMLTSWGPKWQNFAEYLQENYEELFTYHTKICERKENNFNVLNHGDLWTSNILFKYCEFTDRLIGIGFVDYQMTHYNSFALDLQYLLQTSVQTAVRIHHTEELLAAYHSSLLLNARKFNITNIQLPSFNTIKVEMTEKILAGIILSIYLLDAMLVEPTEAANLETLLNDGFDKFTRTVTGTPIYEQKMKAILEPYIDVELLKL